jgi:diguanylate cyclase (GGDEF)-like protein
MSLDVSKIRKEFAVFVVDPDPNTASAVVETLRAAGYLDLQTFSTPEHALYEARELPPHIVVFGFDQDPIATERFLIDIAVISSEIKMILLSSPQNTLEGLKLVARGLAFDQQTRPFVSTLEIVQKVDRAVSHLYLHFENEQVKQALRNLSIEGRSGKFKTRGGADSVSSDLHDLNQFLLRMAANNDLEQGIQIFIDTLSDHFGEAPVLWLKYVPSHMCLMMTQAARVPTDQFRGVGIDLIGEDQARISQILREPQSVPRLREFIFSVFRLERFTAFPLMNGEEVLGVFVVLSDQDLSAAGGHSLLLSFRNIFDIVYKKNTLLKEKHARDTNDLVTGLLNRRHLALRLDDEVSRSRRIMMPLSILTFQIDRLQKLREQIGFQQSDFILKTIASVLRKTARVHDILARTGSDQLVILMPHTPHIDAAIKAEAARRVVEATDFPMLERCGIKGVTVSCGVSEYPSFCEDADGLIQTADEALTQVIRAGGNKVCLASTPEGFCMDFVPREVPWSPPSGGKESGV